MCHVEYDTRFGSWCEMTTPVAPGRDAPARPTVK